ncbi:hypothetical protein O3M35_007071 [Rhynocoris fuscipes]|uniref:Uncharacterized protein n=1 Tax=Rhynocoris fuscipes TaxID=488301 RepID=A0AAW1DF60_9HEMI
MRRSRYFLVPAPSEEAEKKERPSYIFPESQEKEDNTQAASGQAEPAKESEKDEEEDESHTQDLDEEERKKEDLEDWKLVTHRKKRLRKVPDRKAVEKKKERKEQRQLGVSDLVAIVLFSHRMDFKVVSYRGKQAQKY